jgi:hypothetical protein
MVDEVKSPSGSDDKFAEFDEWFEEESADEEISDEEEYSTDSDEEVDVPEEEDPEESPDTDDSEGDTAGQETKEEDPYAWVAELDPEFRKKAESLVNGYKSNSGRAAAEAQRKMELQAQLDRARAELEAHRSVSTPSTPAPQAVPSSEQLADMDDEELKEFMEEYPHVASSVEKLIARREQRTKDEILKEVRPIREQAEAQRVYENKQALRMEAEHIFNTAETGIDLDSVLQSDRWREWVAQQPKNYQRYISTANEVADAAKVLEDFADYANRQVYSMYQAQQEQHSREEASHADETVARRQGALKGSTPKSKTAQLADRGRGAAYTDYFDQFSSGDG